MLLRAVSLLSDDRAFVRVQPKALLTCGLLLRLGPEWLCTGVEAELLGRTDGAAGIAKSPGAGGSDNSDRELQEYTLNCRDAVLIVISEVVAQLIEEVCTGPCLPSFMSRIVNRSYITHLSMPYFVHANAHAI